MPRFGQCLVSKILSRYPTTTGSGPSLQDVCSSIVAILFEEFHYLAERDRILQLDVIITASISFSQVCGSNGENKTIRLAKFTLTLIDPSKFTLDLSKLCKFVSISEFSHILDFIVDSLSKADQRFEHLYSLAKLLTIIMPEAPQSKGAFHCFAVFDTFFLRYSEAPPRVC